MANQTPKLKDINWTVKGKLATSTTWNSVGVVNSAACVIDVIATDQMFAINATKSMPGTGKFQIELKHTLGNGIKETMRAYNDNPLWTNHHIGFTETIKVPQVIKFGNNTYDLSFYNQTTLSRNWIDNNNAKLLKLTERLNYDFGVGWDNLDSVKIIWDGSQAKLAINYLYTNQTVPYQTWFEVDPTIVIGVGTSKSPFSAGGCAVSTGLGDALNYVGTIAPDCYYGSSEWSLAAIPNNAAIINSSIKYQPAITSGSLTVVFDKLTNQPSTRTYAELMGDIRAGVTTNYTSNSACATTFRYDLDLGPSADTEIQSKLNSGDWFAVGAIRSFDKTSGNDYCRINTLSLTVTYAITPPAPNGLSCTGEPYAYNCSWSISNGTGITNYYVSLSSNNSTWPASAVRSTITNVTSYNYTGLGYGVSNYVRVNSTNGANSTSSNVVFVTTDVNATTPLNPQLTNVNSTTVKLNWSPPSSDGGDPITGYRIERSENYACTGLSLLVNKTPGYNYNNTGLSSNQQYCYRIAAWNDVGLSPYTSSLVRFSLANEITTLSIPALSSTTLDLSWLPPGLNGGTLVGYSINYTTPHGTPLTILVNNTNSSSTVYTVSGLTQGTDYSFCAGTWTNAGFRGCGNVINTTTYVPANFTIGFFNFNATNPNLNPILISKTVNNATTNTITVSYPSSYNMTFSLRYQFAGTTQTYNNLPGTPISSSREQVQFIISNHDNDIITIHAQDQNTNNSARYVFQQDEFLLKQQITNFRNGTYGTEGFMGALDLVTIVIFILAMIGFNRINPSVGAILCIVMIFGIAYFEIITIPAAVFGIIGVVVVLIVGSTRKDD